MKHPCRTCPWSGARAGSPEDCCGDCDRPDAYDDAMEREWEAERNGDYDDVQEEEKP